MTPQEARDVFHRSAEGWVENHELIEKFYFLDSATGRGGGLYLWPTGEMAERHHGPDYVRMIAERYGSQPTIRMVDAVLRVEPGAGRISEL